MWTQLLKPALFDAAALWGVRGRGEGEEENAADDAKDAETRNARGFPDSPGVRDARRVHGDDAIAPPSARPPNRRNKAAALALRTGQGFLDREHDAFIDYFADAEDWFAARNACYAHAWDDSGTRLLVTGGPLAYGLKGCYVGVWR